MIFFPNALTNYEKHAPRVSQVIAAGLVQARTLARCPRKLKELSYDSPFIRKDYYCVYKSSFFFNSSRISYALNLIGIS